MYNVNDKILFNFKNIKLYYFIKKFDLKYYNLHDIINAIKKLTYYF